MFKRKETLKRESLIKRLRIRVMTRFLRIIVICIVVSFGSKIDSTPFLTLQDLTPRTTQGLSSDCLVCFRKKGDEYVGKISKNYSIFYIVFACG